MERITRQAGSRLHSFFSLRCEVCSLRCVLLLCLLLHAVGFAGAVLWVTQFRGRATSRRASLTEHSEQAHLALCLITTFTSAPISHLFSTQAGRRWLFYHLYFPPLGTPKGRHDEEGKQKPFDYREEKQSLCSC